MRSRDVIARRFSVAGVQTGYKARQKVSHVLRHVWKLLGKCMKIVKKKKKKPGILPDTS